MFKKYKQITFTLYFSLSLKKVLAVTANSAFFPKVSNLDLLGTTLNCFPMIDVKTHNSALKIVFFNET